MEPNFNDLLKKINHSLDQSGFRSPVFLVGGAVRDSLLGLQPNNDLDFVTEGSSQQAVEILFESGLAEHSPKLFSNFQTSSIRIDGCNLEFVTARKESYHVDSRKPSVTVGNLTEDAYRRDFTVNALMQNIKTGEVLDLTQNGKRDLQLRTLRTPLDPNQTFFDDPLRMLRAVRFRTQLNFQYAEGLFESLQEQSFRLEAISKERIRDEFLKMLSRPSASSALEDLMNSNLLQVFFPELGSLKGITQGSFHHLDVWDHTRLVMDNIYRVSDTYKCKPSLNLVLAGLLHDIGKPATRSEDKDGKIRFFSHETEGAKISKKALMKLKLPNDDIEVVTKLVKNHMRLGSATHFSKPAARRLVRDLGANLNDLFILVEADQLSLKPGVKAFDLRPIKAVVESVRHEVNLRPLESPLNGTEICKILKLLPGPKIGKIKAWLLEQVLDGKIAPGDKDAAKEILAKSDFNSKIDN